MLYLFFTVPLDSLHQTLHGLVLFDLQMMALTIHSFKHFLLVDLNLYVFLFVALCSHKLSIIILFDAEEYLFLVSERYKVFASFELEFSSDFVNKIGLFMFLFDS